MSGKALGWAWDQQGLTGTQKLVLLCLADHASFSGETCECFPYIKRIAAMTGLSDRTVRSALNHLAGWDDKEQEFIDGAPRYIEKTWISHRSGQRGISFRLLIGSDQERGVRQEMPDRSGKSCRTVRRELPDGPVGDAGPFKEPPKDPSKQPRRDEIQFRVRYVFEAHKDFRRRFYRKRLHYPPGPDPHLTPEIERDIRRAIQIHDRELEDREAWLRQSWAIASGIGLFYDEWCTGQENGGKRYLEAWRPWKMQRDKGDPVLKFAPKAFEKYPEGLPVLSDE